MKRIEADVQDALFCRRQACLRKKSIKADKILKKPIKYPLEKSH